MADQLSSLFHPKPASPKHKGQITPPSSSTHPCRSLYPQYLTPTPSLHYTRADKLEQTKLREREIKEAHKAELLAAKNKGDDRRQEVHQQLKEERSLHDTKRSAKDKREAEKREKHAETGQMCEHGVWRCKICFPHHSSKEIPKIDRPPVHSSA